MAAIRSGCTGSTRAHGTGRQTLAHGASRGYATKKYPSPIGAADTRTLSICRPYGVCVTTVVCNRQGTPSGVPKRSAMNPALAPEVRPLQRLTSAAEAASQNLQVGMAEAM